MKTKPMSIPKRNRFFSLAGEQEVCRIYFDEEIGTYRIAKHFGCAPSTIWDILKRNGFKPRPHLKSLQTKSFREKMRQISKSRTGEKSANWAGGRKYDKGYVFIYLPTHPFARKNYVAEHRLTMEKHLNRILKRQEVIHHINGVKTDNRIQNLMLFANAGFHRQHHRKFGIMPVEQIFVKEPEAIEKP